MDESVTEQRKPPYLAFSTLKNLVYELGSKPLPPQIDRSMMSGRSGTDQSYLFGAMKFFGFIDEKENVLPLFVDWCKADEDGRKSAFAQLINKLYPNQIKIAEQNGTPRQLQDSFSSDFNYAGDTRRKAMTFFLQCASWAGVELSVHFKVNKVGASRTTIPRGKRTARKKPVTKTPSQASLSGQGERLSVAFGEAGTVDIQVNISWLKLDDTTFADLRSELNKIQALGVKVEPVDEVNDENGESPEDEGDE